MLVLTRKCNEVVVVGGDNGIDRLIKVTVLGIEKGKVRLGFEAAEDVSIHRQEVWERIRAGRLNENLGRAARDGDDDEPSSFAFYPEPSRVANAKSSNPTNEGL